VDPLADGRPPVQCGRACLRTSQHGRDLVVKEAGTRGFYPHVDRDGPHRARGRGLPEKLRIRRGLDRLPAVKRRLRSSREPIHLICAARLVRQKGLDHQLRDLRGAARSGDAVPCAHRRRGSAAPGAGEAGGRAGDRRRCNFLRAPCTAPGLEQFDWADVLLHTGVIASSGDRWTASPT